jgi:hypothetical protein
MDFGVRLRERGYLVIVLCIFLFAKKAHAHKVNRC